mgnify:CR=1 FL=1
MGYLVNSLALVDRNTGEVIEDRVVFFGKKKTDTGFIKVFVGFLEDMVMDTKVAGKAIRLLLYAVHKVNWNNLEVYLFYKDVVKELGIDKNTYFRWLKVLLNNGYMEATERKYIYRLKPYTFVMGSMDKALP